MLLVDLAIKKKKIKKKIQILLAFDWVYTISMRKKEKKTKVGEKKRTYQTTTLPSDLIAFDEEFENIAHENRPKGCLDQVGFQQLIHLFSLSSSFLLRFRLLIQ